MRWVLDLIITTFRGHYYRERYEALYRERSDFIREYQKYKMEANKWEQRFISVSDELKRVQSPRG